MQNWPNEAFPIISSVHTSKHFYVSVLQLLRVDFVQKNQKKPMSRLHEYTQVTCVRKGWARLEKILKCFIIPGYAKCLDEIKLREQVGRQKSHIKVFLYPWKFGRNIIHNDNSLSKITQIL